MICNVVLLFYSFVFGLVLLLSFLLNIRCSHCKQSSWIVGCSLFFSSLLRCVASSLVYSFFRSSLRCMYQYHKVFVLHQLDHQPSPALVRFVSPLLCCCWPVLRIVCILCVVRSEFLVCVWCWALIFSFHLALSNSSSNVSIAAVLLCLLFVALFSQIFFCQFCFVGLIIYVHTALKCEWFSRHSELCSGGWRLIHCNTVFCVHWNNKIDPSG